MAKVILQLGTGFGGVTFSGTTTRFLTACAGILSANTTEANRQIIYRSSGVLSRLTVSLSANTRNDTTTFAIRIDGSNGSGSVAIGAGVTGVFVDNSNTDQILKGQRVSIGHTTAASSGNVTVYVVTFLFDATLNTVSLYNSISAASFNTASVNRFMGFIGGASPNATEANIKYECQAAGTLKNMQVRVSSNGRASSATVFSSRIEGGTGSLSLSVGASLTGDFEDTAHTDSISVGNNLIVIVTTGSGTGTLTANVVKAEFETTDSTYMAGGGDASFFSLGLGFFGYSGFMTGSFLGDNPLSEFQTEVGVATIVSRLFIDVRSSSTTADSVVGVLVNGIATALSITIPTATTGEFLDTSEVGVAPADNIVYVLDNAASSGSATLNDISVRLFVVPVISVVPFTRAMRVRG